MQNSEEQNEQLFIRGFNNGYILAKYEPQFTTGLLNGIEKNSLPFMQGFISGAKEVKIEKFKSKTKDAQDNLNSRDNDFGLEREKK
ncbi:MAG: hypothetical protein ABI855_02270 [Bacteroidota bacterium]